MKINTFVHVLHPRFGARCLAPGEVPEWAVPLITNPDVIVEESDFDDPSEDPAPQEIEEQSGDNASGDAVDGDDSGENAGGDGDQQEAPAEVPIPPKGGRGGSASKWAEYAKSKGFEVDDDATAADIREALEAEGIPTE
ncbi:hypothetical protein [Glutamicibacter sp. X7]